MRIKLIGCHATKNEVLATENLPAIDYEFLDFSWHESPLDLHAELQRRINASQDYELIILTYGRCSHALAGLISLQAPVLVPAVHDCISLLLGSDERRQRLSAQNPAVYYFSQGWLEYGRNPEDEYWEYFKKYGKKNASYLISTLYGQYKEAVLIKTCDGKKLKKCREKIKKIAAFFDWTVSEVEGELSLLATIASGKAGEGALLFAPGQPIAPEEENDGHQSEF